MAKNRIPGAYLEDFCFEAQQAAEKAIKAVLIKRGVDFPYVHDLARLLALLYEIREVVPDTVRQAESLTPYGTVARYPGLTSAVSIEQYEAAIEIAEAVVRWAEDVE